MQPRFVFRVLLVSLLLLGLSGSLVRAQTSIPSFISYSGRLSDGTAWEASATLDLTITIYSCACPAETTGCNTDVCPSAEPYGAVFRQTFAGVQVVNGYFAVRLENGQKWASGGWTIGNVVEVMQAQAKAWIGITVGEEVELSPRQPIGAVPYAVKAVRAERANTLGGVDLTGVHNIIFGTFKFSFSAANQACTSRGYTAAIWVPFRISDAQINAGRTVSAECRRVLFYLCQAGTTQCEPYPSYDRDCDSTSGMGSSGSVPYWPWMDVNNESPGSGPGRWELNFRVICK